MVGTISLRQRIRELRLEEESLVDALRTPRPGSVVHTPILRELRRRLALVRQEIEDALPEALAEKEKLLAEVAAARESLARLEAEEAHLELRAAEGDLDPAPAALAGRVELELARVRERLADAGRDLEFFTGLLPGGDSSLRARPAPEKPGPLRVPPVIRIPEHRRAAARGDEAGALSLPSGPGGSPGAAQAAAASAAGTAESGGGSRRTRDRRGHLRFAWVAPVKYRVEGVSFLGRCADLSRGGMFVEARAVMARGTRLALLLSAEGYPVEIEGEVSGSYAGVGFGVRFLSVPEADRPFLDRLLARLEAAAGAAPAPAAMAETSAG